MVNVFNITFIILFIKLICEAEKERLRNEEFDRLEKLLANTVKELKEIDEEEKREEEELKKQQEQKLFHLNVGLLYCEFFVH